MPAACWRSSSRGSPTASTTRLSTLGVEDFDGMLTSPMTAHPKVDPDSGGMAFFGCDTFGPPYLRYHEADARGALVHSTEIGIPRATMIHDFGVTATRVVFLDLPVVFDAALADGVGIPFRWIPEAGARVGVLDRGADGVATRWFPTEPCYVFHVMNAFDDDRAVVLDLCRYERTYDGASGEPSGPAPPTPPTLERWRVHPTSGHVEVTVLDDRAVEFPRVDPAVAGRPYRHGYCVTVGREAGSETYGPLVQYDLTRDTSEQHELGAGMSPGEPVFVRAPDGRSDDEGWVLSVVYDAGRDASDVVVLDATSFSGPPEAVVHLPCRVPFGFHGSWVPGSQFR